MTWGELLKQGQERLKKAGIQEYELDAWYLFEQAFSMSRARYFLDAKEEAAPGDEALKAYEDGLERRSGRVPLQHILGTQEFMGMEFFVNAHVLIPRQDTETLVETVLNEQKNRNISVLDMCTGSGCIAVSLKALGGYARVAAADISPKALETAEKTPERFWELIRPGRRSLLRWKTEHRERGRIQWSFARVICSLPLSREGTCST